MTIETIRKQVTLIVAREFELEAGRVTPACDLYDDPGLDSLDTVDLVATLQRTFGFKVEEGIARKIRTVEQLYTFVQQRVG